MKKTTTFFAGLLLFLGTALLNNAQAQDCTTEGLPGIEVESACITPGTWVDVPIRVHNWEDIIEWHFGLCLTFADGINILAVTNNVPGQIVTGGGGTSPQNVEIAYQPFVGGCGGASVTFPDGHIIAWVRIGVGGTTDAGLCATLSVCNVSPTVPPHVGFCDELEYIEVAPGSCDGQICAEGYFIDIAGNVATPSGNPIFGARVQVVGTNNWAQTDANGDYEITNVFSNGQNTVEVVCTGPWPNFDGISQADVVAIQDHALNEVSLDCYGIIAGDVNGSGTVLTSDASDLNAVLTGQAPMGNVGSWVMIPEDFNVQCAPFDENVPQHPTSIFLQTGCNVQNQDFVAVKIGDVNHDATFKTAPGAQPEAALAGISVYPNPFKDVVNLEFQLENAQAVQLNVYDLSGRKLEARSARFTAGQQSLELSGREWPAGMLMYELITAEGRFTGRFLHE